MALYHPVSSLIPEAILPVYSFQTRTQGLLDCSPCIGQHYHSDCASPLQPHAAPADSAALRAQHRSGELSVIDLWTYIKTSVPQQTSMVNTSCHVKVFSFFVFYTP